MEMDSDCSSLVSDDGVLMIDTDSEKEKQKTDIDVIKEEDVHVKFESESETEDDNSDKDEIVDSVRKGKDLLKRKESLKRKLVKKAQRVQTMKIRRVSSMGWSVSGSGLRIKRPRYAPQDWPPEYVIDLTKRGVKSRKSTNTKKFARARKSTRSSKRLNPSRAGEPSSSNHVLDSTPSLHTDVIDLTKRCAKSSKSRKSSRAKKSKKVRKCTKSSKKFSSRAGEPTTPSLAVQTDCPPDVIDLTKRRAKSRKSSRVKKSKKVRKSTRDAKKCKSGRAGEPSSSNHVLDCTPSLAVQTDCPSGVIDLTKRRLKSAKSSKKLNSSRTGEPLLSNHVLDSTPSLAVQTGGSGVSAIDLSVPKEPNAPSTSNTSRDRYPFSHQPKPFCAPTGYPPNVPVHADNQHRFEEEIDGPPEIHWHGVPYWYIPQEAARVPPDLYGRVYLIHF